MADWQVGDLALCVSTTPKLNCFGERSNAEGLRLGGVYQVSAVGWVPRVVLPGLRLEGVLWSSRDLSEGWKRQSRFVKITPGADIEGFEEPRRIPVKEKACPPIINTAHRAHTRHDATGRKPAQPANDGRWPFRHMQDPREERK